MQAIMAQFARQSHAAFRFVVKIDGLTQAAFTECTLPTIEWDVEEVKEGGINTHVLQIPGRRKAARLTLKNGVGNSDLVDWCCRAMKEDYKTDKRKTVTVKLLDATTQNEVAVWTMEASLPVKWTAPQIQSDSNAVAIQTLEFVCGEVTVEMKS